MDEKLRHTDSDRFWKKDIMLEDNQSNHSRKSLLQLSWFPCLPEGCALEVARGEDV